MNHNNVREGAKTKTKLLVRGFDPGIHRSESRDYASTAEPVFRHILYIFFLHIYGKIFFSADRKV